MTSDAKKVPLQSLQSLQWPRLALARTTQTLKAARDQVEILAVKEGLELI